MNKKKKNYFSVENFVYSCSYMYCISLKKLINNEKNSNVIIIMNTLLY